MSNLQNPDFLTQQFLDGLRSWFRWAWDNYTSLDRSIYKNKDEYVEVMIRERIHIIAVDKGIMK
jgi:uncharacterized NAD(P)/FAD-binding protein YdhS